MLAAPGVAECQQANPARSERKQRQPDCRCCCFWFFFVPDMESADMFTCLPDGIYSSDYESSLDATRSKLYRYPEAGIADHVWSLEEVIALLTDRAG
jgi:hypothetical protein